MEKAFDREQWKKLFEILKAKRIDWKDRKRLIRELYLKQNAAVKINENLINWLEFVRGGRQGWSLSPTLFILYVEEMLKEILYSQKGVSVGGRNINCVRFSNDLLIIEMKEYGMKINVRKTKVMKVNEREHMDVVTAKGKIEQLK
ncbi:uncharacterized protein LOC142326930 [Lycorma delicatula]|uniref:uncharacterized protein LOC142326930 n=1 Tax=Lycorma delicatula TaxID=130591 RepID=UPI003F517CE4